MLSRLRSLGTVPLGWKSRPLAQHPNGQTTKGGRPMTVLSPPATTTELPTGVQDLPDFTSALSARYFPDPSMPGCVSNRLCE